MFQFVFDFSLYSLRDKLQRLHVPFEGLGVEGHDHPFDFFTRYEFAVFVSDLAFRFALFYNQLADGLSERNGGFVALSCFVAVVRIFPEPTLTSWIAIARGLHF